MAKKFTEEQTLQFVQLYRVHECLWDKHSDSYSDRQSRALALIAVRDGMNMGLTIADVKAKIKSLRSTYYLEIDKIENSTRSGAGGNVYKPKAKWFDEYDSFVKPIAVRRKTKNNREVRARSGSGPARSSRSQNEVEDETAVDTPQGQQGTPHEGQQGTPQEGQQGTPQEGQQGTPQEGQQGTPQEGQQGTPQERQQEIAQEGQREAPEFIPPMKKAKKGKLSQLSDMIKDLKSMNDDSFTERSEDTELDLFGKCIIAQMKKLSEEQKVIAQEKIQSILTQCKLADIQAKTAHSLGDNQAFFNSVQQSQNTPSVNWNPGNESWPQDYPDPSTNPNSSNFQYGDHSTSVYDREENVRERSIIEFAFRNA